MANPKAAAVVQTALGLLDRNIPYVKGGESLVGMDCQGMVEYCVRASGGSMSYSGSNDMYRNACAQVVTLKEAQSKGLLKPGWLLFILEQDGKEPAKYQGDGIGNASHVGLYTGSAKAEVVHASYSNRLVCASTLKNAWTHCGPAKCIDYGAESAAEPETVPRASFATVIASGYLLMRDKPGGGYMLKIEEGARIPVMAITTIGGIIYAQTRASNANGTHVGWVAASGEDGTPYLSFEAEPDEPGMPDEPDGADGMPGWVGDEHIATVSMDEIEHVVELIRAERERHDAAMGQVQEIVQSWMSVWG